MISFSGLVLLILLYGSSLEVKSEFETITSTSNLQSTNNTPLCRSVRNIKKNLLQEISDRFQNAELICDIQHNCLSTNCTYTSEKSIIGGYNLSLCETTPYVQLWIGAKLANQTEIYNFIVQDGTQRIQIMKQYNDNDGHKTFQKWYLRVSFHLNKSRAREQTPTDSHKYLTLSTAFEVWNLTRQPDKPLLEVNIINDTRFYLNQLCSSESVRNFHLPSEESNYLAVKSPSDSHRLQQNNDEWKPEELHVIKRTSPKSSSRIGQQCNDKTGIGCGNNAMCHLNGTDGFCECIKGFIVTKNGSCILALENPVNPTVNPFPSSHDNAYSSALGALLSVIVLVSVAAAIFFGTKYRVFSRVRNHFSLHLPFRRSTSIDDHVGMVDPFVNDDDDDPPLL